jgi:hypothetical protein
MDEDAVVDPLAVTVDQMRESQWGQAVSDKVHASEDSEA